MLPYLPPDTQNELAQLAERYGQPLIHTANLNSRRFDPLNKRDRYGEVCMVVRRPNGRLLTMKKTFYPAGAYRLLTGGINHGESVFAALQRETQEETGLTVNVSRFLASAAYRVPDLELQPAFYTFAFLLDEIGGTLGAIDADEQVEAFQEVEPDDLLKRAEYLANLQLPDSDEISGSWRDWGQFRAVIHILVWQALQS